MEDILRKIKVTSGNSIDGYKHKTLVLTEEEYEYIQDYIGLEIFALENDIDFINVIYNDTIEFIHYSNKNNEDSIKNNGLIIQDSNIIMDLGIGIYVVEKNDEIAIDNLSCYIEELNLENDILKITGVYSGEYEKCVYGSEHEGYIVILDDIPPNNINIEKTSLDNFFAA